MSQGTNTQEKGDILPQFRSIALVAAGANLPSGVGDVAETIDWAIQLLTRAGWKILSVSPHFETPCFPPGAGPDYVNAAFAVETKLPADEILAQLHEIEAEAGRERIQRWGQRSLDLDLIALDQQILPDERTVRSWMDLPLEDQIQQAPDRLLLPHPRLQDRAFVLVPLLEVAPDWVHPLTGQTIRQMHDALPQADREAVKRLVNPGEES